MQGSQLRTANKRKGVYLVTNKKPRQRKAEREEDIPLHRKPSKFVLIAISFLQRPANIRKSLSTPVASFLRIDLLANNSLLHFSPPFQHYFDIQHDALFLRRNM